MLDIKTDCMLAVQYHEGTVDKNCDPLEIFFRDTEDIASSVELQF